MPFGVVFSTSNPGGPLPFTRIRGQLLVGQSAEPAINSIQTGTVPGGATGYNGSAAAPLYSYYNRPDTGFYASNQTSSASDIRYAQLGTDLISYSTAGMVVGTGAFTSTAATGPQFYVPQSTGTMVPGVAPAAPGYTNGAALVWNSVDKTLEVYSTVTAAWMRLHSSSGVTIVFSSS